MITRTQVENSIERSFEGTVSPLPGQLSDGWDEWELKDFSGKIWKNWKDIPHEILERNDHCLSFFNANALHFFFPACMYHALGKPLGNLAIKTIYTITPIVRPISELEAKGRDNTEEIRYRKHFLSRISYFTNEQKRSVALFLQYMMEHPEFELVEESSKAFKQYWKDFK